ncbi:hypothetical protein ACS0TY_034418 [Phlomoides rotata]
MQGSPWYFGNYPLLLHHVKVWDQPSKIDLHLLNFWVQIFDLPMGFFMENVGRFLGNFVGHFLEYDTSNTTATWRNFMCIKVAIDVRNPLKRHKKLKQANGTPFTVSLKYERLQAFCFMCGRLGHTHNFCDIVFDLGGIPEHKGWGMDLKTPECRQLNRQGTLLGGGGNQAWENVELEDGLYILTESERKRKRILPQSLGSTILATTLSKSNQLLSADPDFEAGRDQ